MNASDDGEWLDILSGIVEEEERQGVDRPYFSASGWAGLQDWFEERNDPRHAAVRYLRHRKPWQATQLPTWWGVFPINAVLGTQFYPDLFRYYLEAYYSGEVPSSFCAAHGLPVAEAQPEKQPAGLDQIDDAVASLHAQINRLQMLLGEPHDWNNRTLFGRLRELEQLVEGLPR